MGGNRGDGLSTSPGNGGALKSLGMGSKGDKGGARHKSPLKWLCGGVPTHPRGSPKPSKCV